MMNKEKQIEEMAKALATSTHSRCIGASKTCGVCDWQAGCLYLGLAKTLVDQGYRKSTEVASEIFAEIEELKRYIRLNEDIAVKCKKENGEQNEEYWKGKVAAFRQIRAYIDAELKKKYTKEITEEGK